MSVITTPPVSDMNGGFSGAIEVMQVGAVVYCDSQCIVRELERRFPEPTLFPEDAAGMASSAV